MIVSPDFLTHWKTQMLIDALGEASPLYLIRLWAHCQQRKSTRFDGMSSAALKALCRASCDANDLERVLTESGFILRDGDAIYVPKWEEYNSSLVAAWENGKKGGRPKKEQEKNPAGNQEETQRLTQANPRVTHGQPSGEPIREDKIREDKNEYLPTVEVPDATASVTYAVPDCPVLEIVKLYHDTLPELPRLEVMTETRRAMIRQRWKEVCANFKQDKKAGLEWWGGYFDHVRASDFLMGRTPPDRSGRTFRADLEWLVRPSNFAKVQEDKYHGARK